jgi:threonine dehydrogenase-like Zn-dependent dehydrogenase
MIVLKENLNCIKNTQIQSNQSLAIVGTGPASQSMVMWAKRLGVSPVVVFGRREKWASHFADLGADAYAVGDDYPPEIFRILDRGGFDRTIEAVGSNEALRRCLQITRREGRVHLYGMPADDEAYKEEYRSDPRVFRSPVVEAEVHDELLGHIEEGRIDLSQWVSHVLPLADYRHAFAIVKKEKPTKVVLTIPEMQETAAGKS